LDYSSKKSNSDGSDNNDNITEKMYKGIGNVFVEYTKRFSEYAKENTDTTKDTINNLAKISGALGYMAQVHASLAKAYEHEKRLEAIEKKLQRISPDQDIKIRGV